MKFIHLGDLHLGKIVNGFNMLDDQRFALERILDLAKDRNVDAFLLAGDIYDKSIPSAEAVCLFDWFLSEIADSGIKVFAIPGNHDSAERIAYAQGILEKQGIHFPPLFDGNVRNFTMHDDHGPVTFWLLPFLKPATIRPFFPDCEIDQNYTKALDLVISQCAVNESERNVILSHQFVTACGAITEREESELTLGGMDNVDASVFNKFDYVALGHVHRPQQVGRSTVRYSGSLLKYSFSEVRYPKSAVLVELGGKQPGDPAGECVSIEKIPYPTLHDMREIKGPLESLIDNEVASQGDRNDYLHVTLTDEKATLDPMSKLRSVYPNVMQLDYERPGQSESGYARYNDGEVEEIDPFRLFEQFFQDQAGMPMNEDQASIVKKALERALERSVEGKEGN